MLSARLIGFAAGAGPTAQVRRCRSDGLAGRESVSKHFCDAISSERCLIAKWPRALMVCAVENRFSVTPRKRGGKRERKQEGKVQGCKRSTSVVLGMSVVLGLVLTFVSGLAVARVSQNKEQASRVGLSSLPATAQGTISARLGRDLPAYWVRATSVGLKRRMQRRPSKPTSRRQASRSRLRVLCGACRCAAFEQPRRNEEISIRKKSEKETSLWSSLGVSHP